MATSSFATWNLKSSHLQPFCILKLTILELWLLSLSSGTRSLIPEHLCGGMGAGVMNSPVAWVDGCPFRNSEAKTKLQVSDLFMQLNGETRSMSVW